MRKLLITAVVAATALAVTAVALAATQQNYRQTFTAKKTSKPTGTIFHTQSLDNSNQNNHQPANTKEVDIIFPKGAKINTKTVPVCKATDSDFATKFQNACPSNTLVGHDKLKCEGATAAQRNCSGHATARLPYNGSGPIHLRVYAYNGPNHTLLLYNNSSIKSFVIHAAVTVTKNPVKIIAKVPMNCVLGTPNGCGKHHETARLDSFDLTIDKITKKGKPPFIATPKSCPKSKNWKFQGTFKYWDNKYNTTSNADDVPPPSAGHETFNEPSHGPSQTKSWLSPCS